MTTPDIVFVGNARCYHTMDWYRSAQLVCAPSRVAFATDLIESEGHARLVVDGDDILSLLNVDRLLFRRQSHLGNLWRNAAKSALMPVQAVFLRRIYRRMPRAAYHAHTMYYMVVCWMAGVPFVGTPQGSEILVRPRRSRVYRWFASRALREAEWVTVDSEAMASGVLEISGRNAVVVQNGIDIAAIEAGAGGRERSGVLSIRGIDPNYRIDEILAGRARSHAKPRLTFLYPYWEDSYKASLWKLLTTDDRDLGRLPREAMYAEMGRAALIVSVPRSDSSPRSVYEAIFAGACVAATENPWIDALPPCMRARVRVVDLGDPDWLDDALAWALCQGASEYVPSREALEQFDQRSSMRRVAEEFYRHRLGSAR